MPNERVIPNNAAHEVVNYEVLVEGQRISPEYQVQSVVVHDEVNRLAAATIVLIDGDPSAETFAASESAEFVPGKKITLNVGLDSDRHTIFQGVIVGHAIRFTGVSASTLTLECRHAAVKMTLGRKNRHFENQKDSAVIETILGEYGLKGQVDATTVTHKQTVQFHATDWDFMVTRAEVNGLLAMSEGDKIALKKPTSGSPVLELTFGANLIEIEAGMDARSQWKAVKNTSWSHANQALQEVEHSSATFTEPGNISGADLANALAPPQFELRHSGAVPTEELQSWAEAAVLKSRMAKIRGRVKITGFPTVKPGDTVQLAGCGDRFNGAVYVTAVRQEVSNSGWLTHIQFGLSPEWFAQTPDMMEAPAGGLIPAVHGLQIGVCVQLENDPDGEDRILVKFPTVDNQSKGVWARICALDAGSQRGTFFRPEIGDEVVVGFINDDPRHAMVLGMLHSSAKPAWETAKDTNHIKGLWTRSQMKWLFDDDKKIITVETPGGNKFVISEQDKSILLQDQNGNSLKMNDSGIEIKSIKDIKIEASANIEIKAGADLKAEGSANAELKAGAQLKASGSAAAEFSSGGATTLKGSVVQIN